MLCGVLGNLTDEDARATVAAARELAAPGALVLWTRGRFRRRRQRGAHGAGAGVVRRGRVRGGRVRRAAGDRLPGRSPPAGRPTAAARDRAARSSRSPAEQGGCRLRWASAFAPPPDRTVLGAGPDRGRRRCRRDHGAPARRVQPGAVSGSLQPASVQSRALLVSLVDQETGERGFLLTGDDAFLKPYRDGGRSFTATVAELRRDFAGDAGMTAAIDRVAEAAATWRRVGATPEIAVRRSGDGQRAEALVATGRGKAAFDEVRRRVASLQALIDARTRAARAQDADDLRLLRNVILVSRGAMIVILVFSAFLLRRMDPAPDPAAARTDAGGCRRGHRGAGPHRRAARGGRDRPGRREHAPTDRRRARGRPRRHRGAHPAQPGGLPAAQRADLAPAGRRRRPARSPAWCSPPRGCSPGTGGRRSGAPDGGTALVLADVSGHGAEAGLVAFAFKQRITALLDTELDLATAFEVAARHRDADDERFLSCLVVVIDPDGQRLSWINAGHPPALVVRPPAPRGLRRARADRPADQLGDQRAGRSAARCSVPTTCCSACTDGVLEARDLDGREFGTDGTARRACVGSTGGPPTRRSPSAGRRCDGSRSTYAATT